MFTTRTNREDCLKGMAVIKMVQVSKHKWMLVTSNDNVLQEDINVFSIFEAEDYVKRYISSFQNWNYVLIPMEV